MVDRDMWGNEGILQMERESGYKWHRNLGRSIALARESQNGAGVSLTSLEPCGRWPSKQWGTNMYLHWNFLTLVPELEVWSSVPRWNVEYPGLPGRSRVNMASKSQSQRQEARSHLFLCHGCWHRISTLSIPQLTFQICLSTGFPCFYAWVRILPTRTVSCWGTLKMWSTKLGTFLVKNRGRYLPSRCLTQNMILTLTV